MALPYSCPPIVVTPMVRDAYEFVSSERRVGRSEAETFSGKSFRKAKTFAGEPFNSPYLLELLLNKFEL